MLYSIRNIQLYKLLRIFRYVALLLLPCLTIKYYIGQVEANFYAEHKELYQLINEVDKRSCNIPNFDAFDPSIMKYIDKNWPRISCGHRQYPLTYVDSRRILHINKTAVYEAGMEIKNVRCSYHEIIRLPNDDDVIELGPAEQISAPINITKEFIVVRCYDKKRNYLIYETGHAIVRPLEPNLAVSSRKALQEGGINVLVIAMDSMSRLNFIRQMPKSYEFMQNKLNASVLRGLIKNGRNTYPNMITMLSGISWSDFEKNKPKNYFDDMPAVWNNFSSRGYVTMFGEDLPEYGMFNYLAKGFHVPPTDFYMRPFWLAMDQQKQLKSKDKLCYGHLPKYQFLWNYTEQFVINMHQEKHAFFALSFLTEMSHDLINTAQLTDDDLFQMLTRLYNIGVFENTLFLLMGDHGQRIDSIRSTNLGRIEDSMPFLSIHLPKKLQHMRTNLEANTEILTSWSDVYEMLIDVAINNLNSDSRQVRYGKLGLSLLRPIPSNRSCEDLGISEEFCVCGLDHDIDVNSDQATSAGISIISYLNDKLAAFSHLCAKLDLDFVERAQIVLPAHQDVKEKVVVMRVTIVAKPAGALLEATLQSTAWTRNLVIGDVNRINKYGNQSICIDDAIMRQYCYCMT